MTDETKKLLLSYGLSQQQVASKALNLFVDVCAKETGILDKEMIARRAEYEQRIQKLHWTLIEAETRIREAEFAKATIKGLEQKQADLEQQIEQLKKQKNSESIDDAKTRNFMALCEWLTEHYSEQQIKSLCNVGKGFFGGWIDPPAEFTKKRI